MRKRILITGGAGYVGRPLVRSLHQEHDVCVVDTLNFGIERFDPSEISKFRLEQVDICEQLAVKAVIDGFRPDVVVHLAAIHFIPLCEQEPGRATATNVVGTINLLATCPSHCRFVFASSGAVYSPSDELHDERFSELSPRDVYGFTKLHGEHYVRYFAANRRLATIIVRLFNVVGPGETNPHLLPDIIAQMKAGHHNIKLGNLWPKRDYIHVRDAAAGFRATAFEGSIAPGESVTVNIGTSQQYSVGDIISLLREVSGMPLTIVEDPGRVRLVDRPFLGAAINEVVRRFGWTPQFNIRDAIKDLWRDPDFSSELRAKYRLGPTAIRSLS